MGGGSGGGLSWAEVDWRCRSTDVFAIIFLHLEIYYIVPKKLVAVFLSCRALANNFIHRTDAVHVWLLADVVSHGHPRW